MNTKVLLHPATVGWFASLFLIFPLVNWLDYLLVILAFMIAPLLILAAWVVSVPLWLLGMAVVSFCRKQRSAAFRYLIAIALGAAFAFLGLKCGDVIAVLAYGPRLKSEVAAVKAGAAPQHSDGIFSSATMAFRLTGGFLDISNGIAYDESGQAAHMLPLPPSARPSSWQENAVDVLTCRGAARHLFGNFYAISVSGYDCN